MHYLVVAVEDAVLLAHIKSLVLENANVRVASEEVLVDTVTSMIEFRSPITALVDSTDEEL